MSREAAGAAIRSLREARNWTLAELAAASGISVMGLSFLERGVRKPHKSTVEKVENGLGLPPGSYVRLLLSDDPRRELAELSAPAPAPESTPVVVDRSADAAVFEGFAEAQLEAIRAVIARLPSNTANEYETYIHSVVTQCVKAELLAANSWRVAVNAGSAPSPALLGYLRELERTRTELLARLPGALATQFDRACTESGLPEAVIAVLVGVGADELWNIRTRGSVPAGALARVRAFVAAHRAGPDGPPDGTPDGTD